MSTLFFNGANMRPSDERLDIFEAEYGWDQALSHGDQYEDDIVRAGWDESQAIEILAIEPGWLFGEKFYPSRLSADDDFAIFQQSRPSSPAVDWRSIDESSSDAPHVTGIR